MESYRDIYKRFIANYRTDGGGINLYPQFDYDLDTLLEWLRNDYDMNVWAPGRIYLPDEDEKVEVDCSWRPVEE